ncbi:hypothetical protein PG913_01450 [Tenacibaculum pacificus]|uniref:hypothetical protein n=1 Tax=Tenacibaculum pacificus TaxID=3018314 RepID=UPI0022F38E31|nr:hypothetical protein [Tenacibaculum pacificus]WBX73937.1 hypothetical protein PG913_01450 [Tenacibaculum pacificus]
MYNIKKKPLYRGFFCFKANVKRWNICYFLVFFLCENLIVFSQEKLLKTTTVLSNDIEINTDGLDDILIENSKSNQIEVLLLDENPHTHTIYFQEKLAVLKIDFNQIFDYNETGVFRKYITKRLQRVRVIVKVPKNKNVIIYGKTIGIVSKSYQGNVKIYIDKGNVRLNNVKGNAFVSLFLGNVYANLSKKSNIDIKTNNGIIRINNNSYKDKIYIKKTQKEVYNFKVNTINANVILITE